MAESDIDGVDDVADAVVACEAIHCHDGGTVDPACYSNVSKGTGNLMATEASLEVEDCWTVVETVT